MRPLGRPSARRALLGNERCSFDPSVGEIDRRRAPGLTCISAAGIGHGIGGDVPAKYLAARFFRVSQRRVGVLIPKRWRVGTLLVLGTSMKGHSQ